MRVGFNTISTNNSTAYLKPANRPRFSGLSGMKCDFFRRIAPLNFEAISSETIKRLYSTKFKPSGKGPKGSYSTFVIDKLTDKPVEVFVIKENSILYKPTYESYNFFIYDSNRKLRTVGDRSFVVDESSDVITPGAMYNYYPKRFAGIGIRGHQLAVERMMQKGANNVEISALLTAYPFHKKCGFIAFSDELIPIKGNELDETLRLWSKETKLSNMQIIPLLEYTQIGRKCFIDRNLSLQNIGDYMCSKGMDILAWENVGMRLSQKALQEWKRFAKAQPIFYG